ncbi:MAG TPA: DUF4384 domain-containing protein [Gemmatimonadales bacterium]|nr:DUF4384 domain-containing protein [Gemmatimonadales bacterium]
MITTLLLLVSLTPKPAIRPVADLARPHVELWTSGGDNPYDRGDQVRVYFRPDQDAYLTVLRVDTDGRIRVLFPREPWEDNFARGGKEYEVLGPDDREAFSVDDDPGVGYVFAVASADPFFYDPIKAGDHWDYASMSDGRVTGDPYVALTDLAQRIAPSGDDAWDYDLVPYYVQRQYDYPRFLCYDCHAYQSWTVWDPYNYSCVRFRVVVYNDPYYYPYRYDGGGYYGGRRVVFTRPLRPEPRFVFKDRDGSNTPFVTHVAERPANEQTRRTLPEDQRGRGSISDPIVTRPRGQPGDPGTPDARPRSGGDQRGQPSQPAVGQPGWPPAPRQQGGELQQPGVRPRPDVQPPADQPRDRQRPVEQPRDRQPPEAQPPVYQQPRDREPSGSPPPARERPQPEPRPAPPREDHPRAAPPASPPPRSAPAPRAREPELRRRKP